MSNRRGNNNFNNNRYPILQCSVCGKFNVQTKHCDCRRPFLKSVPQKHHCDKIRLEGSPARLVFDIMIGTDVIPAIVDTRNNGSVVNRDMILLLQRLHRYHLNNNNTINLKIKIGSELLEYNITCMIQEGASDMLSLGLSSLLDVGVEFSLNNECVRGLNSGHVVNRNVNSRNNRSYNHNNHRNNRNIYKYDNRNRHYRRPNDNFRNSCRNEVVITYPPPACSENWDEIAPNNVNAVPDVIDVPVVEHVGNVVDPAVEIVDAPEVIDAPEVVAVPELAIPEIAVPEVVVEGAVGGSENSSVKAVEPVIQPVEFLIPEHDVDNVAREFGHMDVEFEHMDVEDEEALLSDPLQLES